MNKYLSIIFAALAMIVVLVVLYFVFGGKYNFNQKSPTNNQSANAKALQVQTITLTANGFSPKTLTVKVGARVVWLNRSGTVGSVNSDSYPTNLLYPFLNFGTFKDGSSFSTVFSKAGTYTYYNYSNLGQTGSVIVK